MKVKSILLSLVILTLILLSGCFPKIKDEMEIITGNFESEIIEEKIDKVGLLTQVNLTINEINKEEYDSLDSNKFIGWLDKDKYYEIALELTIDEEVITQELLFKSRSGNMPDSYVFKTYFNSGYNSISIVPTIDEEITGYTMYIEARNTRISGILLYCKET